jgi:multidrug efflux pump subunit AcrB
MGREVAVRVDPELAAARGLSVSDVANLLGREHLDVPLGSVRQGEREYVALVSGRVSRAAALADLRLPLGGGGLRLGEIAAVKEGESRQRSLFVLDGEEWVLSEVRSRPGANPILVSSNVKAEVQSLSSALQGEFELRLVSDGAVGIKRSVSDLALSALMGALLSAFVLALFMRDARLSLVLASNIPLCAAIALSALAAVGRSINLMSLGGLSLAVGMMTDNAVIVLDALDRDFGLRPRRPSFSEVAEAAWRTAGSTFGSTATTAIVFIPTLFLPGVVGSLFFDLAFTVIVSVSSSWLLGLLVVPSLYRLCRRDRGEGHSRLGKRRTTILEKLYAPLLARALRKPLPYLFFSFALGVAGLAAILALPREFAPAEDAREIIATLDFPAGTSMERLKAEALTCGKRLLGVKGIAQTAISAGMEKDDYARQADLSYAPNRLSLRCSLAPSVSSTGALAEIERNLQAYLPPDVSIAANPPLDSQSRLLGLSSAGKTALVYGATPVAARDAAGRLSEALRAKGFKTGLSPQGRCGSILVRPRAEALALVGFPLERAAENLRCALDGEIVSSIDDGEGELDLRVLSAAPERIQELPLGAGEAGPLRASSFLFFDRRETETVLARESRRDAMYLGWSAPALPGRQAQSEFKLVAQGLGPATVGEARSSELAACAGNLLFTGFLVILLLYLFLAAEFESVSLPFAVLLSIPLSLGGVGAALALAGSSLNSGSAMGLIALSGVVVNNAIVMRETMAQSLSEIGGVGSATPALCVYRGALLRLRPICVTALSNVLSLLPIALSPSGATQKSMAIAMAGGNLASTALSLIVMPSVFLAFLRKGGRL